MFFVALNGRLRDVPINRYRVNWNKMVSGPQKAVKDFVRPYWEQKLVLEEMRIPGGLKRLDLICPPDSIIIEVDGLQHDLYNPWMHGSKAGYLKSMKSDLQKQQFADLNGYTLIRIKDEEIKRGLLSVAWIQETFGITL